jgi:hypothetical protein
MNFLRSKIFTQFFLLIKQMSSRKKLIGIILFAISIIAIAFFDKVLVVGIVLISFLSLITFLILYKLGIKDKTIQLLFLIVVLIHIGAVLFIHYANFQPFGGGYGDYILYQQQAQEVAQRIAHGNFSLEGIVLRGHYYSVILGYLYFLTLPEMLVGQLFGVWLAVISVILVYLIVLETGSSKKLAFWVGLITAIYPSYLLFGSLLLKDVFVIPLILFGLLLTLKLIKNFLWRNFVIFYITLGAVIHFRFYVGYALLFTFIPCWLLLGKLQLKKKIVYGMIIILLLGFLPQFFGYGYYGFKTIKDYLAPEKINFYREIAYTPPTLLPVDVEETPKNFFSKLSFKAFPNLGKVSDESGSSSSIKVNTKIESLACVLLGPFPWQIQNYRQLFVFLEIIPWYLLLFFITKGIFVTLRRKRIALPLLVFSVLSLGVLALFITNFGIITRIRIPSFIALLCLIPLAFDKTKILDDE